MFLVPSQCLPSGPPPDAACAGSSPASCSASASPFSVHSLHLLFAVKTNNMHSFYCSASVFLFLLSTQSHASTTLWTDHLLRLNQLPLISLMHPSLLLLRHAFQETCIMIILSNSTCESSVLYILNSDHFEQTSCIHIAFVAVSLFWWIYHHHPLTFSTKNQTLHLLHQNKQTKIKIIQ